ncbi:MAG: tetratricopeptide repeat protein [Gammaproteobacteria bacterium]
MSLTRFRIQLVARAWLLIVLPLLFVLGGCERSTRTVAPRPAASNNADKAEEKEVDPAQSLALAEAAYEAKDWRAAEQHYVTVTKRVPDEAHPWFRLGNIYARTERPDFAVRAYKEALIRDPQLSKAWYNMGLVQLRQSANSFLQMRTHTAENSAQRSQADAMYESLIEFIQKGPDSVSTGQDE